ncbi:DNA protecting protein DprA [Rhodothalassium salexigens]|uniref:DNA-processing protein DprA n=1 Tax=Rhodothalassium salexigens TaxID=1086 RepID=UPI00191194C6|nr:DNA-processing protein DprA [Rhodothalassium salexigens]MBK5921137.1 DNA protecting protein DprA [Rhodothalassium salexigens]
MNAPSTLPQAERLARLRLIRTETVGPITYRQLMARYGTAVAALEAVPLLARRGGRTKPPTIPTRAAAERELAAAAAIGAEPLFLGDSGYPPLLSAIEDAPPVLYARGSRHLLDTPGIAIVGARNASAAGRRMAGDLARGLGAAGVVVVSGLARGIDAAAHDAALATGTIAVLAGGADIRYPRENAALQDRIAAQGLLVTEAAPGTEPQARHFPRRNRIISGLVLGVVVVEAAERSGSLITARLAGDQGREVFAVPGSPLDPRAKGANRLLRDGAHLVESARDILELLDSMRRPMEEPAARALFAGAGPDARAEPTDDERARLRLLLSPAPTPIDDLVRLSALTVDRVLTILLEMELGGTIQRHPGGRVALV